MIDVNGEGLPLSYYITTPIKMMIGAFLLIPCMMRGVFEVDQPDFFSSERNPCPFIALGLFIGFSVAFSSFTTFHLGLVLSGETTKSKISVQKEEKELTRAKATRRFLRKQQIQRRMMRQQEKEKLTKKQAAMSVAFGRTMTSQRSGNSNIPPVATCPTSLSSISQQLLRGPLTDHTSQHPSSSDSPSALSSALDAFKNGDASHSASASASPSSMELPPSSNDVSHSSSTLKSIPTDGMSPEQLDAHVQSLREEIARKDAAKIQAYFHGKDATTTTSSTTNGKNDQQPATIANGTTPAAKSPTVKPDPYGGDDELTISDSTSTSGSSEDEMDGVDAVHAASSSSSSSSYYRSPRRKNEPDYLSDQLSSLTLKLYNLFFAPSPPSLIQPWTRRTVADLASFSPSPSAAAATSTSS